LNLIIKVIIYNYNYTIIVNQVITSICSILLWSCSSFSFFVRLSRSLVYETGLFNQFILLSTNLIISLFCRLYFLSPVLLSFQFTCSVYKVILISLYCLFCLPVLRYCLSCPLILPFLSILSVKCSHSVWHVY